MPKPLVVSLWCASVLLLQPAIAGGPPRLTQEQMGQPDEVAAWLRQNEALADKKIARMAFDHGLRKKKRKDWGGAAKAFAESAIHYPAPAALTEYAENSLRMFGDIRQRDKAYTEHWRRDLGRAEAGYRTALAADAVVKQLNEQERRQTGQNAECLAEYLKTSVKPHNCPPLEMYGMEKPVPRPA
jgi:hypothetical protein